MLDGPLQGPLIAENPIDLRVLRPSLAITKRQVGWRHK